VVIVVTDERDFETEGIVTTGTKLETVAEILGDIVATHFMVVEVDAIQTLTANEPVDDT
jgi:hypothetical protein